MLTLLSSNNLQKSNRVIQYLPVLEFSSVRERGFGRAPRVADPDPHLREKLDPDPQGSQNSRALEAQNGPMESRGRSP